MAFEDNYHKKAEDYRRNSLASIVIFLIATIAIVIVLYDKLDEYLENRAIEKARIEAKLTNRESKNAKVLEICKNIKTDDRLQFIKNRIQTEEDATTAVFTYQLNGDMEEAISKITNSLTSFGWKQKSGDNLELENGYRTISIVRIDYYQKLEIRCRQRELTSKIYD